MRCDLSGKVSLVTGAGRGIGKAIADRLAANGSTVVYSDVDEAMVRETAAQMPGAQARRMDVTDAVEVVAAVDWIASTLGRLDILVNNAGVNTLAHRVPID